MPFLYTVVGDIILLPELSAWAKVLIFNLEFNRQGHKCLESKQELRSAELQLSLYI